MSEVFRVLIEGQDPDIRQVSKPVENIDEEIKPFLEKMKETLAQQKGVGLAAVQVGILKRFALVCYKDEKDGYKEPFVMINPKILSFSDEMMLDEEGCLSIPGVFDKVYRHKYITVEYKDLENKTVKENLQDFDARVVQHEIDHMNGILFLDRI